MHPIMGYTSYFVLGYYLNNLELNKRQRMVIYLLGIFGFAVTVLLDLAVALRTQQYCSHYYSYFSVNVLWESLAVFVWFKYHSFNNSMLNDLVRKLSVYSFGAYLVHALVIEQLDLHFGLNALSFHSTLAVPCVSILVFVISFSVSALINQIPVLKKYLV